MKVMTDSMFELKTILNEHARRYPQMQPADAVKLIYQNEFGSGHMIPDGESCLQYLRKEYESVTECEDIPAVEPIGNGIERVHLSAIGKEELEQLGGDFIRCAEIHKGTLDSFLEKLDVLRQLTRQGRFAFDAEELEEYLTQYARAGYPAVSHSETYRKAYCPAYRIRMVKK